MESSVLSSITIIHHYLLIHSHSVNTYCIATVLTDRYCHICYSHMPCQLIHSVTCLFAFSWKHFNTAPLTHYFYAFAFSLFTYSYMFLYTHTFIRINRTILEHARSEGVHLLGGTTDKRLCRWHVRQSERETGHELLGSQVPWPCPLPAPLLVCQSKTECAVQYLLTEPQAGESYPLV